MHIYWVYHVTPNKHLCLTTLQITYTADPKLPQACSETPTCPQAICESIPHEHPHDLLLPVNGMDV